jgi:hypothetical protein
MAFFVALYGARRRIPRHEPVPKTCPQARPRIRVLA